MGTVISQDGRFEWEEDKNILNKENHGFYFEQVLEVFDDPFILETYDSENSSQTEDRLKAIASFERRSYFFLSYTMKGERTRIITARLAEPHERRYYDEHFKNQTL
jgi:uncharacterized DUF497 family protein